jgi:hypothetical protein
MSSAAGEPSAVASPVPTWQGPSLAGSGGQQAAPVESRMACKDGARPARTVAGSPLSTMICVSAFLKTSL